MEEVRWNSNVFHVKNCKFSFYLLECMFLWPVTLPMGLKNSAPSVRPPHCPSVCKPFSQDWLIIYWSDFSEIVPNERYWEVGKSGGFRFLRKFFYAQNEANRSFWGLKSTLLDFSWNLFIRFFWNCTWWHIKEWSKVNVLNFEERLFLCPKWDKCSIFGT